MDSLSTNVICVIKFFKTLTKLNIPNDVYKYMYVESPSSSTAKINVNNNQQEEVDMIDFIH